MELERIEFLKSNLQYESYIWQMPKSRKYFLVVFISGDFDVTRVVSEKSCLRNKIDEFCSQHYRFSTVILDFTRVQYNSDHLNHLLPDDSNVIGLEVGVVIPEQNFVFLNNSEYMHFFTLEDSLSKLAFQNRKLRFDGGKSISESTISLHLDTHLRKYRLEDVSVRCELWKWTTNNNVLYLLSFSGEYPLGSQGENEGSFIGMKIRELDRDFSPIGLIIDFSNLHYEWGDDIQIYPWRFRNLESPIQFIFSDDQHTSFEFKFVSGENRISNNFEDARLKLEEMIESFY